MKIITHFKPILLGIILFLIVNIGATLVINGVPAIDTRFNGKVDNHLPQKLALLQLRENPQVDVLALGTSQTHNDFSTAAFDQAAGVPVQSFNMGLPGTRYDVMQTYLQYHIRHYGKPKLVVLEVTDALVEDETVYFYLPALHYHTLIKAYPALATSLINNPLVDFSVQREVVLSFGSAFYQFRPLFTPISLMKKVTKVGKKVFSVPVKLVTGGAYEAQAEAPTKEPEEPPLDPALLANGWAPKGVSPGMASPEGIKENARAAKAYYLDPLKQVDFAKLHAFLTYCREEDIDVVLVQYPSHPSYRAALKQSAIYGAYQKGIADVIAWYGVRFVDLNQESFTAQDHLYADTRHMNAEGAQVASRRLAQRVFAVGETDSSLSGR